MYIFDKSFRKSPRNYIKQSLLALLVVAIILIFLRLLQGFVVTAAALGASTFIVFAMPNSITAEPRRLIGGHVVGLLSGAVCFFAFLNGRPEVMFLNSDYTFILAGALSVGLSIFLMTITNTEHPPAATTALGIAANGWSFQTALIVLIAALGLTIARRFLRPHLRDLF